MSSSSSSAPSPTKELTASELLHKSVVRALGGGAAGAAAMAIQVVSLMWLRTTMNYQYRNGTTTTEALRFLYKEGGIPRLYKGLVPALAQGPLSRFGDTAANTGVLMFLNSHEGTKDLPISVKSLASSTAAATWRIFLMPVDTVKTSMQVDGKNGIPNLMKKYRMGGIRVFFHGALAASGATLIGHYPWFATYNFLDKNLPKSTNFQEKVIRSAAMGFCSSIVSDTVSNSVRVIKTTKQTFETPISYYDAARVVVDKDGLQGLFGRGLKTRILANGLQGLMFSVLWRLIDDTFFKKDGASRPSGGGGGGGGD
ncbi:hypothetical protein PBRA_004014 [Plasmodiophora brassicae]|nr:hypothetical protein PBRA_004014 [Plasmodiophora brassicae]